MTTRMSPILVFPLFFCLVVGSLYTSISAMFKYGSITYQFYLMHSNRQGYKNFIH
jgi:hypothetical protein